MYVGHFAIALTFSSKETKKGTLTYLSLASVISDLLMLSLGNWGPKWNFHADGGLILCLFIMTFLGLFFRLSKKVIGLAWLALCLHVLMDLPYMSRDATNLYAHPLWDFALEGMLFTGAALFYLISQKLTGPKQVTFILICVSILLSQAYWNFSYSVGFWK